MIKNLIRQPLFWVSFLFVFGWLLASLIYYWVTGDYMPKDQMTFDDKGYPVSMPPHGPLDYPPLGSDDYRRNIFIVLLVGAKFTFGIAFLIAIIRVVLGVVLGVFGRLYLPRITKAVLMPLEGIGNFPLALIAFFFLNWVIFEDGFPNFGGHPHFSHSTLFRVLVYSGILIALALPLVTGTFFKTADDFMQFEFLETTKILGGSRWHILTRHFPPFLLPQLFLVVMRELIQVLILMAHIGVLNLFIGGAFAKDSFIKKGVITGYINDWSALVGEYWHFAYSSYPYFALIPIIALTLAILAAKGLLVSVEKSLSRKFYGTL